MHSCDRNAHVVALSVKDEWLQEQMFRMGYVFYAPLVYLVMDLKLSYNATGCVRVAHLYSDTITWTV